MPCNSSGGNGAGIEQIQRLIGKFAQRSLLNPFRGWVNWRERFLQFRGAEIALYAVFRVDHLCPVFPALGFTVGQHSPTCRQAIFHCRAEVEKTHRQDAGTVAYLAGHHSPTTEGDSAVQHFSFYGGVDARQKLANWVQMRAVFITQRKV